MNKTNNMEPEITIEQARKVLETIDAGLCKGVGEPVPGSMCVEAAVCYGLGLPFGDDPDCVSRAVRAFKIALNDRPWSSNSARAKGMRRVGIAQLGSRGIEDEKFARALAEQMIRRVVPTALRSAASSCKIEAHRVRLLESAARCESDGTKESAYAAADAADATYAAANAADAADATYAAADAAYAADAAANAASYTADSASAADAAANAASYAADAAAYAADAAADAANAAAYTADSASAASADRDSIYTLAAECAVDALRICGSPGVKLMDEIAPLESEGKA